jgi:hypothetical protein
MLKLASCLSLAALPLIALSLPLDAAMLRGTAVQGTETSGLVQQVQKRGKKPPSNCSEPMKAEGKGRPTEGLAKSAAEKAWQDKVKSTLGDAYVDIKQAREIKHTCTTTPTLRLKRCEFTAQPCRKPTSA